MRLNSLLKAVLCACLVSTEVTAVVVQRASMPLLPPSKDPFYNAPSGFEHKKPGTILKHRKTNTTTYGDPYLADAYQLLYRTTSTLGQPQVDAVTVLVPKGKVKHNKYLSYQIPYDAPYVNCGPSYTLHKAAKPHVAFLGSEDLLLMSSALAQGWYVSTPDYEGPRAAYTAGLQAGYSTLDSVRAVLASHAITGIAADASSIDTALWGYSGGALASEWALELQSHYAPELKFVGAALGGLTPNYISVFHAINKSLFAGLAVNSIIGLSRAYPNLSNYVHEHLKPKTKANFLKAGSQCYYKSILEFAEQDITSYFNNPKTFLTDKIPVSVLQAGGTMGLHGVPKAPLFVYKSVNDEISPVADTDALVKKFCKDGVNINYQRNVAGEHVTEGALGAPAALRFLVARMNGVKLDSGCNIIKVNTTEKLMPKDEKILTPRVYKALQKILKSEHNLGL